MLGHLHFITNHFFMSLLKASKILWESTPLLVLSFDISKSIFPASYVLRFTRAGTLFLPSLILLLFIPSLVSITSDAILQSILNPSVFRRLPLGFNDLLLLDLLLCDPTHFTSLLLSSASFNHLTDLCLK